MILYRPIGTKELELIQRRGNKKFPPRLSDQSIFYPVLNEQYAVEIARDWNMKYNEDHKGYVTRFEIEDAYASRFDIHVVDTFHHQELWVPARELAEFNRHILGEIEVILTFSEEKQAKDCDICQ